MGLITPNDYDDLRSLYTGQLQYLLSTENQIIDGLQSMIEHAQDTQLKQAFQTHQQETRQHAQRLEQILGELEGEADDKKDPIITALIGSGTNIVRESSEGPVRDAGLIATAQKIEHYEIASYGSARDWARTLGLTQHAALLEQTLNEEKHTDQLLTTLSQRENVAAASASGASAR
jgi:ferritin-like metal-binding protein YciE